MEDRTSLKASRWAAADSMRLALVLVGAARAAAGADRFGLRTDWPLEGLRPLESLALCGNATYAPLCDRAARFRAMMRQRARAPPRALPVRPTPLRVRAAPPSWLSRGPGGPDVAFCEVPCAYAEGRDEANLTLGSLRPVGGAPVAAVLNFESGAKHWPSLSRPGVLALTYSRFADVVYEFHRREDVDWAARAAPPRPRRPSSAVYVSHCVPWRAAFLADLEAAGVALERHGACDRAKSRRRGACETRTDFNKRCKIDGLAAHPFAITLENSLLDDYVTEKWTHAWESGAVVVYLGSPLIYEKEAAFPPFINALDFDGPRALAAYLHEVLANDALWAKYTARDPLPNATRSSARHWGGITLDRHVCDACLAFYGA